MQSIAMVIRPHTGSHVRRRFCLILSLIVLAVGSIDRGRADSGLAAGEVFGYIGKKFTDLRPLPKWNTLLMRYRDEEGRDADCRSRGRGNCPYTEWKALIDRLEGLDRRTQVEEVNRFANDWRYVTDPVNWGVDDYWATPGEFFAKAGDCEDYAIVKFMSLRALGFDNADLSLVAVMDLNLDVGHAVLLVEVQGQTLLLDNQIKRVAPAVSVRHYKPVFSANEKVWWLFK
ncbi:transglutaminase-like cysteine peptidase [Imhoffiella purpurea]|uniref:Uncharacterized protein n=1 Tax=Imhoffiella purpurea TaxID=1249627 RepID=W9VJT0_9GAMM|nr:transglutaminase-like cysteine peptidase [Imhoffiella purpurea]EXJ16312.1 hypothetical protein D779_0454 [Imhoffiella purpurea]